VSWVSDYCARPDPRIDDKVSEARQEIEAALRLAEKKKERAIMGRLHRALAALQELLRL
jgi:hypothetical protein